MTASIQLQGVERDRVLSVASRVLEDEGPDALTVRRIAQSLGSSTQLIYTLFGGKVGLVDALYRDGFRSLAECLSRVPTTDQPLHDLMELGFAYRANALRRPAFYGLMFGRAVAGYDPPKASRQEAVRAFRVLADASRRLLDADTGGASTVGEEDQANEIALRLWGAAHGMVSLELAGLMPDDDNDARYARHVRAICTMNMH